MWGNSGGPCKSYTGEDSGPTKDKKEAEPSFRRGFWNHGGAQFMFVCKERDHEKIWDEVSLFLSTVFALGLNDVCLM